MTLASRYFAFMATVIGMLPAATAQEPAAATNVEVADENRTISLIVAAKSPEQAEDHFRSLFRKTTAADLKRLQTHESDLIALQATWRLVDLTVPEKESPQVKGPDRDQLARFLGFLEGRCRMQVPAWWSEGVLDAWANRRGNIYAGGYKMADRRDVKPPPAVPPEAAKLSTQGGKTLVRVGKTTIEVPTDKTILRVGKTTVEVPTELIEKVQLRRVHDNVSALLTPSRCFVAFHEDVGYPYSLVCVDRETKRIVWTSEVWASWWGDATGQHKQWVEITEQDDRIIVFGIAATGFHAEAFSASDGKNLWRFSNAYSR